MRWSAYLQAFAGNLVSAGIRLGSDRPDRRAAHLGGAGASSRPTAGAALTRDPADFGAATFAVDLASMAHETQYSRLFRS